VSASPPRAEIADLASLEQVRALAGRLAGLERIDVLINNAGLVPGDRRSSVSRRPPPATTRPRGNCGSSARR
jgi:NAD(P)-dependent dehydrogenase (short-subunit alcohol dehydrogenase family)